MEPPPQRPPRNNIRSPKKIGEFTWCTMAEYKFEGWLGLDADSANGKLVWGEFEPKPWEETDVDVKVTHCGICYSDLHTLRSGWVRVRLCTPSALVMKLSDESCE
ncbi:hypothetical protein VTN49DRAFT_1219 [Thermomyces lanuginosus]|uniref:uncharacterized protein n=1 Tax=Thermomyces lanuginosus TaxID=5541 RepID=UPI0037449EC2